MRRDDEAHCNGSHFSWSDVAMVAVVLSFFLAIGLMVIR
jgi:hypothetical protein